MPKGTFSNDIFEKLTELGSSTTKKTVQSVAQTFSPLKILEGTSPTDSVGNGLTQQSKELKNPEKHTPLEFEKLKAKYSGQDKQKETALRQRLFQLVKEGEKEASQEAKQTVEERQKRFRHEDQVKKKKEDEKKLQEQQTGMPEGKKRRSIFSPKAKAREKHAEFKPATGKQ